MLAVDSQPAAIEALLGATPEHDRERLQVLVADLASFEIPACDLVNASVSLQFLDADDYARTFERIAAALAPGGRFAGLLYGDRDEAASEPAVTCPSPDAIRAWLRDFQVESWTEREEDGKMALGDPHHIHLIEVVARRRDGVDRDGVDRDGVGTGRGGGTGRGSRGALAVSVLVVDVLAAEPAHDHDVLAASALTDAVDRREWERARAAWGHDVSRVALLPRSLPRPAKRLALAVVRM